MKLYLSSHKLGNKVDKLIELVGWRKIGFIPNALDYVDEPSYTESNINNMNDLINLWIKTELLDLKDYFWKQEELEKKIDTLGWVWVRWWNTYILRQAFALSGLDNIVQNIEREDFIYWWYSAGACLAWPTLQRLDIVDDLTLKPYGNHETIRDGLQLVDYCIAPHYQSNHHESIFIEKEVTRMIENKVLFKALKDGEVIITE